MVNIVIQGFLEDKLITQGYHSSVVEGRGIAKLIPEKRLPFNKETLTLIRNYLMLE